MTTPKKQSESGKPSQVCYLLDGLVAEPGNGQHHGIALPVFEYPLRTYAPSLWATIHMKDQS